MTGTVARSEILEGCTYDGLACGVVVGQFDTDNGGNGLRLCRGLNNFLSNRATGHSVGIQSLGNGRCHAKHT